MESNRANSRLDFFYWALHNEVTDRGGAACPQDALGMFGTIESRHGGATSDTRSNSVTSFRKIQQGGLTKWPPAALGTVARVAAEESVRYPSSP